MCVCLLTGFPRDNTPQGGKAHLYLAIGQHTQPLSHTNHHPWVSQSSPLTFHTSTCDRISSRGRVLGQRLFFRNVYYTSPPTQGLDRERARAFDCLCRRKPAEKKKGGEQPFPIPTFQSPRLARCFVLSNGVDSGQPRGRGLRTQQSTSALLCRVSAPLPDLQRVTISSLLAGGGGRKNRVPRMEGS